MVCKMFSMFYSIDWPNFIVSLPLLLEVLDNISNTIVCFPGCDLSDFKINLIFYSSRFSTWSKRQDKNLNIFRIKRAFNFWRVFSCQKLSHTWECIFNWKLSYVKWRLVDTEKSTAVSQTVGIAAKACQQWNDIRGFQSKNANMQCR